MSHERTEKIIQDEIASSTGPTGGWLDSPKAVCAAIIEKLRAGVAATVETPLGGTIGLDGDTRRCCNEPDCDNNYPCATHSRKVKADTLFYCDGNPMNVPKEGIYWDGWQRLADWLAGETLQPASEPTEEEERKEFETQFGPRPSRHDINGLERQKSWEFRLAGWLARSRRKREAEG